MSTAEIALEHQTLPPSAQLLGMLFGKHIAYCISAVARLGVADHIGDDAAAIDELASKTGAKAQPLYRVMRVLASVGIFTEPSRGKFGLTALGSILRSDAPGSMRYMAMMTGDPWSTRSFEYITESLRTGRNAVSLAFGKPIFEQLSSSREEAEVFHRAMTNISGMETGLIVDGYDFSGIRRLADVGGGHGFLLASILERNPALRGVLFDLPQVVAGVPADRFGNCADRIEIESGSFFERAPAGCDAYIMKHIIHDWSDEKALTILKNCHKAGRGRTKVILVEAVLTPGNEPSFAKWLDLEMLLLPGGRERTEADFARLFEQAGFVLTCAVQTKSPVCVLEAERRA